MPVVLSQRTWHGDPKYLDREGVIYHFARQFRNRINDFDRFVYYRPAAGASTYIGTESCERPLKTAPNAGH